jgi:hypothetical protein
MISYNFSSQKSISAKVMSINGFPIHLLYFLNTENV